MPQSSNKYRFFKIYLSIAVIGSCTLDLFGQVSPFQSGAYLPGIIGVRDYSYPEFKGITLVDYNLGINANELTDQNGDPLSLDQNFPGLDSPNLEVAASGYINSLMMSYTSEPIKFLGNARYMGWINPSFVTVNVRVKNFSATNSDILIQAGDSGFGDLNIAPLYLSWRLEKFDITAGYLFTVPTGRYEIEADDNIGVGFWSHSFQAVAYYYLADKATAFMLSPTYEIHGKIKDSDAKPGSRFALEYGISQYFTERFEVTVQGGHAWQIGDDTGDDIYWDASYKDQLSTVGIGLGYWLVSNRFYGNLKGSTTYLTKQHFNANAIQLQLIYTIPFN